MNNKPLQNQHVNPYKAIATRYENGFDRLVSVFEEKHIVHSIAVKVADLYVKEKIAKIDFITGQFTIKHGMFFDDDVIANAVAMVADQQLNHN